MEKEITIIYKPNLNTLEEVTKYLILRLPSIKMIVFILLIILFNFYVTHWSSNRIIKEKLQFTDAFPFIIALAISVFIYFRMLNELKRNLLRNKRNLETQNITFSNKSYIQQGETFRIENFWNELYQIKETSKWILIYPRKNSAFPIVKADLKGNEYNELKAFFNSLNIKKSLK